MAANGAGSSTACAACLAFLAAIFPPAAVIFVLSLFEPPPSDEGFDPLYIGVGLVFLASFPLGIASGRAVWRALRSE